MDSHAGKKSKSPPLRLRLKAGSIEIRVGWRTLEFFFFQPELIRAVYCRR